MTSKAPELGMGYSGTPEMVYTDAYRAFFGEYRRRYPEVTITMICGYNPQHLLTDQRSELAKFAALHRPLGETYQPILTDPPYHQGGLIRRFEPGEQIAMLPAGEHVVPNTSLLREQMQARLKRNMTETPKFTASFKIGVEGIKRFNATLRQVQDQMRAYQDRMMLMSLYAGYQGPMFSREHRIAKLLLSADPRQRKRGDRLFRRWRKTRPGINMTRAEMRDFADGNYRKD